MDRHIRRNMMTAVRLALQGLSSRQLTQLRITLGHCRSKHGSDAPLADIRFLPESGRAWRNLVQAAYDPPPPLGPFRLVSWRRVETAAWRPEAVLDGA
jgi:hypothetical protein